MVSISLVLAVQAFALVQYATAHGVVDELTANGKKYGKFAVFCSELDCSSCFQLPGIPTPIVSMSDCHCQRKTDLGQHTAGKLRKVSSKRHLAEPELTAT